MNRAEAKTFLALLGATSVIDRGEWVMCSCPLAPWNHKHGDANPSFGVHLSVGSGRVHCYGCLFYGTTDDLLNEIHYRTKGNKLPRYQLAEAYALLENLDTTITLPEWEVTQREVQQVSAIPESWLDAYQRWSTSYECTQYLKQRGLTKEIANDLGIRYDKEHNRVCFPLRDMYGDLVGMRGRALNPDSKVRYFDYKYEGKSNSGLVWHGEDLINWLRPIVITEGSFDMAKVKTVYSNAVAGLTASFSKDKLSRLCGSTGVILFLDNDQAGNAGSKAAREYYKKQKIPVEEVIYTTEYKDPGSLPTEVLHQMLGKLVPVMG